MLPDQPSPIRRLADHLLEGGLAKFVTERRTAGLSWRRIERELWTVTDGQVDVTFETLRSWFPDTPRNDAGAVA